MPFQIEAEDIEANYNKFTSYAKKCSPDKQDGLARFFDTFEERLAMCPGSARVEYHRCGPGGLVEHSLRVLKNCNKLKQVYADEINFTQEEMIFGCLFHDIGKIGTTEHSRYLEQTSDWHRKQGMLYSYNSEMAYMPTPQMGVWLMQEYGIPLTWNEYMSILLNDGPVLQENKQYCMKEPMLAILVHQADRMACEQEKNDEK